MGCILETKKRYVGYKFESESEEVGSLDAKGIEMVRRDQCKLVTKIQEKVARLLFTSRDLSLVKEYLQKQWEKVLTGGDKLTPSDYRFSKEVKIGHYAQGYGGTTYHTYPHLHPDIPLAYTLSTHTLTIYPLNTPCYCYNQPTNLSYNPPSAIVAYQAMVEQGKQAQPPRNWRVPYVVVSQWRHPHHPHLNP